MQLFSLHFAFPVMGDDWGYATHGDVFYNLFNFTNIYGWQRGRHFADILMSIAMLPFGRILYNLGVDALLAQKIAKSLVGTFFIFVQVTSLSYLVYFLNNKKNFKMIFSIITMISLYLFSYYRIFHFTITAAYIASLGFSLLAWIPFAYYWSLQREFAFFKNNPIFASAVWIFILYCASFTIEQSSLAITGLSFFMIFYYILSAKTSLIKTKEKIPSYLLILLFVHIILTTIAFSINALFSARGRWQKEIISESNISTAKRLSHVFLDQPLLISCIFVVGIIFVIFYISKFLKTKKITKEDYISFSFIFTGLLGVCAFSFIMASYTSCLIFISVGILLSILNHAEKKSFMAIILAPTLLVFFININLNRFSDSQFLKNDSDRYLVNMFIEAEKNNLEEIIISKEENNTVKDQGLMTESDFIFNTSISSWMQKYEYTKKIIPIRVDSE
ncbi:MAG: hypothetical protein ACRC5H_07515 [Treponemataceae bacterium]